MGNDLTSLESLWGGVFNTNPETYPPDHVRNELRGEGATSAEYPSEVPFCNPDGLSFDEIRPFLQDDHRLFVSSRTNSAFFRDGNENGLDDSGPQEEGDTFRRGNPLAALFQNPTLERFNATRADTRNLSISLANPQTQQTWAGRLQQYGTSYRSQGTNRAVMDYCRVWLPGMTDSSVLETSALHVFTHNTLLSHQSQQIQRFRIRTPLSREELTYLVIRGNLGENFSSQRAGTNPERYELSIIQDWSKGDDLVAYLQSSQGQRDIPDPRRQEIIAAIELGVRLGRDQETTTHQGTWMGPLGIIFTVLATVATSRIQYIQYKRTMDLQREMFEKQMVAMTRQLAFMERQMDENRNRNVLETMGTDMTRAVREYQRSQNLDSAEKERLQALSRITDAEIQALPEGDRAARTAERAEALRILSNTFELPVVTPTVANAINQILEQMTSEKASCPLLTGPAGAGKTTIVQVLAYILSGGKLEAGWNIRIPRQILERIQSRQFRVVSLEPSAVMAGTRYRGDLEERVQNLMRELDQAAAGPESQRIETLVFMDEIHALKSDSGSADVRNLIKTRLGGRHPGWRIIGATTDEELGRFYEIQGGRTRDTAMVRRFPAIRIEAETPAGVRMILEHMNQSRQKRNRLFIEEGALQRINDLSFRAGGGQPVGAINLYNRVIATYQANSTQEGSSPSSQEGSSPSSDPIPTAEVDRILRSYTQSDVARIVAGGLEEAARDQTPPAEIERIEKASIRDHIRDVVGEAIWDSTLESGREGWVNFVHARWRAADDMTRGNYQVASGVHQIPRAFTETIVTEARRREANFQPPVQAGSRRQVDKYAVTENIRTQLMGSRLNRWTSQWGLMRRATPEIQTIMNNKLSLLIEYTFEEWDRDGFPVGENGENNPGEIYYLRAQTRLEADRNLGRVNEAYTLVPSPSGVSSSTPTPDTVSDSPYRTAEPPREGIACFNIPRPDDADQSPWERDTNLLQTPINERLIGLILEGDISRYYSDYLAPEASLRTFGDLVNAVRLAHHSHPREATAILERAYRTSTNNGESTPNFDRAVGTIIAESAYSRSSELGLSIRSEQAREYGDLFARAAENRTSAARSRLRALETEVGRRSDTTTGEVR